MHHQAATTDVGTLISRSRWTNKRNSVFVFSFSFPSLNETHRLRSHTLLVVRNPIHTAAETGDCMQTARQADDHGNNSSVSNFIAATANTKTKRQTNHDAALRVGCGRLFFERLLGGHVQESSGLIKGLFG